MTSYILKHHQKPTKPTLTTITLRSAREDGFDMFQKYQMSFSQRRNGQTPLAIISSD